MTRDEFWRRLCEEIDRPQWADDPRFATMHARFEHRDELLDALAARLKEASAAEWEERLRPLGIAVGAVTELGDALDGELVRSRDMVVSIETSRPCVSGTRSARRRIPRPPRCTSTRGVLDASTGQRRS